MSPAGSEPEDGRIHVMRVYSRLEVGGIEQQMLSLLPRLNTDRYRVSLCLLRRAGELAGELRERGVPVHVLPFRGRLRPTSLARLSRLFRTSGTRVVHAHMRASNVSATVAGRLARVPVLLGTIHSMNTIRGGRRRIQERFLARIRTATIAVSEGVKANYCETVGVDRDRVRVVYNGVDLSRFGAAASSPAERPGVLSSLGVGPEQKIVVCVARLVPAKSHETLLDAVPPVLARAPETTFLLVGDGPLAPPLQERARRLGVADRVVFAGARSDVAAILRSSDVSVLTSSREGFSNVVIESLAAGLPMVATDVGGNAEAIEAGLSGFLFEPGDVAALSSRLLDLLLDEDLRRRMGQAARRRAERFSLERAARATLDLYDQLLAGRA